MIDNNVKINIFIQFLKDINMYDDYINACGGIDRIPIISKKITQVQDNFYLNYSFDWSNTQEGFLFWNDVANRWIDQKEDYYKQYKRNDLIDGLI